MYKRILGWQFVVVLLLVIGGVSLVQLAGGLLSVEVAQIEPTPTCSFYAEDGDYCECSGGQIGTCSGNNCDCSESTYGKDDNGALDIKAFEELCRSLDYNFYVQEGCSYEQSGAGASQVAAYCVPILCRETEYSANTLQDPMCSYALTAPSPPQAALTGYRSDLPRGYTYVGSNSPTGYNTIENNGLRTLQTYCNIIGGSYALVDSAPFSWYAPDGTRYYKSTSMLYSGFDYSESAEFHDPSDYQNSPYPFFPTDVMACAVTARYDLSGAFSPAGPNCEAGSYALQRGCGPEHECDEGEGCTDMCVCKAPYAVNPSYEDDAPDCYLRCGNWEIENGEECDSVANCDEVTCQCADGYEPMYNRAPNFENACVFDECPDDRYKLNPGICGCGEPDSDSDSDGVADCIDDCPDNRNLTEAGTCGCTTGVYEGIEQCEGGALCSEGCSCPRYARFTSDGVGGCVCAELESDPYAADDDPLWGEACCKRASDPLLLGGYGCPEDRYCMPYPQQVADLPPLYRCRRTADSLSCPHPDPVPPEDLCATDQDCKDLYVWQADQQAYVFDPATAREQSAAIAGLACVNGVCCGASGDPNIPAQYPCSCSTSSSSVTVTTSSSSVAETTSVSSVPSSTSPSSSTASVTVVASSSSSSSAVAVTSSSVATSVSFAFVTSSVESVIDSSVATTSASQTQSTSAAATSQPATDHDDDTGDTGDFSIVTPSPTHSASSSAPPSYYFCCDSGCVEAGSKPFAACVGPYIDQQVCTESCAALLALRNQGISSDVRDPVFPSAPRSSAPAVLPATSSRSAERFVLGEMSAHSMESQSVVISSPKPTISSSSSSSSSIRLVAALPICGDGIAEGREQCDDGNTQDGDGCNRYCELERSSSASAVTISSAMASSAVSMLPIPTVPPVTQPRYAYPMAQLQPLIQGRAPAGDTGPAAVAVIGAGAAAGFGWMRRQKKR